MTLTEANRAIFGYEPCDATDFDEGDAMPLDIQLTQGEDRWTLELTGELDYSECSSFRTYIDRILKAAPPATVVDLSELEYLDSSGLGLLLSLSKEYGMQGGRLVLITNETVDNILSLTRLNAIFSVAATGEEADGMLSDTVTP
jgi:anti-sigma B factor antagonist